MECGRPVPEARVGDDAQDCFCSSACATFAAARGQVQFRPGRQDTEEPTSSAAVPDQVCPLLTSLTYELPCCCWRASQMKCICSGEAHGRGRPSGQQHQ